MMSSWPTNKHWPRSSAGKEDTEQQGRTARLLYNCPHDPSATPTHRASPTALLFRDDSCLKQCPAEAKQRQQDGAASRETSLQPEACEQEFSLF